MKWIKIGGLISLVIICGLLWIEFASKSYLPFTKRLQVNEFRESVGLDAINCRKVELSRAEYLGAIKHLNLEDINNYPKLDTSPANCKLAWWDIDFPKKAAVFKRSANGHTREFGAYERGYFYYTFEVR